MQGVKDLVDSERGWIALAILLAATALAAFKIIDGDAWVKIAMLIGGTIIASKTVTGIADARKSADQSASSRSPT